MDLRAGTTLDGGMYEWKGWIGCYFLKGVQIDELSEGLSQRIAEQLQQRKSTDASLNQTTAEFLRADDKLLLSLQKLANELEPERPEDAELSGRIHNLCAR